MKHETLERMTWSLVAALGDEHGEDLLHLLTCTECREAAAAVLRSGDGLAAALVPDYDPVFRRLEAGNVYLLEEARLHRASNTLARLVTSAETGDPSLPQRAQRYTHALRQTLRLDNYRVEPPPAA